MAERFTHSYRHFGNGVVTSLLPNQLPATAGSAGWNSILKHIGAGQAVPGARAGVSTTTATPLTGSPALLGQHQYTEPDGTIHHLVYGDTGIVAERLSDNTYATLTTSITAGERLPSFANAKDYMFFTNGAEQGKFDGTTSTPFGIVRPDPPTPVAGTGAAMTGVYDVAVTYENATSGNESSRSDSASVTLTASGLDVSWSASVDTQVTHVRVYIRKQTLGSLFFQAARIAIGTTTTTIDLSDVDYSALIIVAPSTTENDPPPAGTTRLVFYKERMFAIVNSRAYYSNLGKPESFSGAYESINAQDGKPIVAVIAAEDRLYFLKRDSVWALRGDDPTTWEIILVDPQIGCVAARSIWSAEGMSGWWSEQGPVILVGGVIRNIGQPLIEPTIGPLALSTAYMYLVAAAVDIINQRVLYAVPTLGSTRLDLILPYSYRLNVWEASGWTVMDVASLGVVEDGNSQPQVYLGGYAGQLFLMNSGTNDGVPSGTSSGSFTMSGTSMSTLTDSGFLNTGGKLIERYFYLVDANNTLVARRRITTNTATVLTFASAISGLTDGAAYTWFAGAVDFYWDTKVEDGGKPFHKKRFNKIYLALTANNPSATVRLSMAFNYDSSVGQQASFTASTGGEAATWDVSLWDVGIFGTEGVAYQTKRIGRTGKAYKVRVGYRGVDTTITLREMEVTGELWRDRA